jgi:hypothetical protein
MRQAGGASYNTNFFTRRQPSGVGFQYRKRYLFWLNFVLDIKHNAFACVRHHLLTLNLKNADSNRVKIMTHLFRFMSTRFSALFVIDGRFN